MSDFILSCCSTADMPKSFFQERNVAYVCFHFNMDGKDYPDDLGESMPFPEFYKRIEEGAQPTTSQVNVDEFTNFFEPFLKEGKDILHVSLSSGLSGSFNSASIAARDLMEKYPERTISVSAASTAMMICQRLVPFHLRIVANPMTRSTKM